MNDAPESPPNTLYFAYGSNLDGRQMRRRCPDCRAIGPGVLQGFRWLIMTRGYASVVPSPGDEVLGIVFQLSAADEEALDRYEGVAAGLYRKERLPVTLGGHELSCLAYVSPDQEPGIPKPEYVRRINDAIADARLPAAYVERYIRPFVPGPEPASA